MVRVLYYGDEPAPVHQCKMPVGNIPVGTVVHCEDCGRYWRLARYKKYTYRFYVPGSIRLTPKWYELGTFGIWRYVNGRGAPHVDTSSNPTQRRRD